MWIKAYRDSLLAGVAIALGGTAFLSVDGGTLGAFLFSVGLLTVCVMGLNLFTGKVCYVIGKESFLIALIALCGNLIACCLMGFLVRVARPELIDTATAICEAKLDEGFRVIPLGIVCNMLIFIAVECWRRAKLSIVPDYIAAIIIVVLCVMVFIVSGTEHCIANMFYMTVSGMIAKSGEAWGYLGLNIIGNIIGGVGLFRLCQIGA